jgi:translation initiation factor 2 beta subunit (eIF-2beta)/eIF-5
MVREKQNEVLRMIETTILEYLHKLPDSLQQEVLHYTQFLLEKYTTPAESPQKKRQAGFLKGTFALPLAEDFNEPLEDFQEYME